MLMTNQIYVFESQHKNVREKEGTKLKEFLSKSEMRHASSPWTRFFFSDADSKHPETQK